MKKIPAVTILIIILFILPCIYIFADSTSEIDKKDKPAAYNHEALELAQANVSTSNSDIDSNSSDDDYMSDDELMNDFDDLEAPHVSIADPLEPFNRAMFHFNDKLYFWILKPVAKGYGAVVPEPARKGVKNFFKNLLFPVRFVSCVFQGKFNGAGIEVDRFLINSTFGLAGFIDVASDPFDLKEYDEDLGQTLGSYGIGDGFFITWPILGPSSARDTIGDIGDAFLDPLNYVDMETKYNLAIQGFDKVNGTSLRIGEYEDLKKAALDPYVALRDAYYQYRQSEIKK